MVFRVTNQAQQQSVRNNIFRISESLFKATNAIASGKRIARPSDDPSGARESLALRTSLAQTRQFARNINNIKGFTRNSETVLAEVVNALQRAKELTIGQLGGASTAQTRSFGAVEVANLLDQVVQVGNKRVGGRFAFGGTKATVAPFQTSASGAVYLGNTERIFMEIERNVTLNINLPGSEVLATDLNPTVTVSTLLSDLNRGGGIPAGSFNIADRTGNSAVINVNSGDTVGNVISAINAAGLNVTASVNSAQNGIELTDSSVLIVQPLTVTEVGGGTAALKLGIFGVRNGNLEGLDLDPRLNAATLISQLNGGAGLSLESISIVNSGASGAVSLISANTVGDVVNLINNSGLNVTAGINAQGNVLRVVSNDSSTVAVVGEMGGSKTAESLGLGGGRNIITNLVLLRSALEKNDVPALRALLANLDAGLESLGGARARFGTIGTRLEESDFSLDKAFVDKSEQLANIEDIDFAQKASELVALEQAFQATLNASARILRPSILDFLA